MNYKTTIGHIVSAPKDSMLGCPDGTATVCIRKNKASIFWLYKESPLVFVGKEAKKLDSSDRVRLYGVFARINKNGDVMASWEKIYIDWKHAQYCA